MTITPLVARLRDASPTTRRVLGGLAVAAAATPPAFALAATPETGGPAPAVALHPGLDGVTAARQMRTVGHDVAERRVVRAARRVARLRGDHLSSSYAAKLDDWSAHELTRHARVLRRKARSLAREQRQERTAAAAAGPVSGALQSIAACESGGDPHAIGGGGAFRGKYQFTYSTWAAVGGSGDPAAAPEAEQDRRAAMLYAQAGPGQWPVCGR
jgi:hypothetical protein